MEDDFIKAGKSVKAMAISPNNELVVLTSQHYLKGFNIKTKEKVLDTVIQGYGTDSLIETIILILPSRKWQVSCFFSR